MSLQNLIPRYKDQQLGMHHAFLHHIGHKVMLPPYAMPIAL